MLLKLDLFSNKAYNIIVLLVRRISPVKVLFISANTEPVNMPVIPLGLCGVASYTHRSGHDVKLIDLMKPGIDESIIKKTIKDYAPEVIGVSIRNIDNQCSENTLFMLDSVKEIISNCRSITSSPIVLGGAGYSLFPESALDFLDADFGIQGEGEISFQELLKYLENGEKPENVGGLFIKNVGSYGKRFFSMDLDLTPLPSAHIIPEFYRDIEDIYMPIQSRRGCHLDCTYCSTATIEGKKTRKRSPEFVVDAIASYKEAGFSNFFFTDNTFNFPASYAAKLCEEIIKSGLNIKWRCIYYPVKSNIHLVKLMAEAGCTEVSLGFESGCDNLLHKMNKKFNTRDVIESSKIMKDEGITTMGFLLLGGPGETRESVIQSLEFAESLKLDATRITTGIRIYPHTALAKLAKDEGYISPEDDLLYPKFYIVKGLEDWLRQTVKEWAVDRPNWIV